MPQQTPISVIKYDKQYGADTVTMWRESKARAIGQQEPHSFDDHLNYLNETLTKECEIYLAVTHNPRKVIGLLATDGQFIHQLYIHNEFQRSGLGTKLIELAKDFSSGELKLYTFEVNHGAQKFYEKHGFRIISRGSNNNEGLPDMLYKWSKNISY